MSLDPLDLAHLRENRGHAPWLERLPATLERAVRGWQLEDVQAVDNLSFNFVAFAARAGEAVVLKVGDPDEMALEMDALRHYGGEGCVRLLESDPQAGAALLERVWPGESLRALEGEDEAVQVACAVMRRLHRPPPPVHRFTPLGRWLRGLLEHRARWGAASPLPEALLWQAEQEALHLLETQAAAVVLHGDLHHDNLLRAEGARASEPGGGWTAIDPKGLVGEPAFEVGPFFYNPWPQIAQHPQLEAVLARRLDGFARGLNLERERLRRWAFVQATLSACWSFETGEATGLEGPLRVARALSRASESGF